MYVQNLELTVEAKNCVSLMSINDDYTRRKLHLELLFYCGTIRKFQCSVFPQLYQDIEIKMCLFLCEMVICVVSFGKAFLIFQLAGARIPCGEESRSGRALIREIMAISVALFGLKTNLHLIYIFFVAGSV